MEHRALLAAVHQRPGMYNLDGTFGQFCAYVDGMDAGNDGRLLTGFREWLITRLGVGNNLTWQALVVRLAFPGSNGADRDFLADPEHNRLAVETLFSLLDEFFALCEKRDGLVQIYDEYLIWLKAQSWYQSSAPRA